ncbi:hypothetical protein HOT99_gp232 [Caulobacter phage CcrBL10]|uniref:Uncharacterized protein n=1 Tax=Caulobacter phage CcrBL10 TaxID=2283269 RepID=A0A385EBM4_9CAUD|nr:hypothetical protein HOT99_gp232 [Caulobacter phage CcrBL10]AXQ68385.1 hypothetical protein CcrBL10_gp181c [Caulobacter phage CcrBL10]
MIKRPYTRPITYSLVRMINLLDTIETDTDNDIEAIQRLESVAYFHGRDGDGKEIPSPTDKEWKIIQYVVNGDCYGHRSLATIRKMVDDHLNDPEVRWALQPGDRVVVVTNNPPHAESASIALVSHCEHRERVVKNLASGGVRIIEPHDVVFLVGPMGTFEVKTTEVVPLVEDDPTGYVLRAYMGLWKMQDLLADTPYFKELKADVDQIKSELAAAVGATAFQLAHLRD